MTRITAPKVLAAVLIGSAVLGFGGIAGAQESSTRPTEEQRTAFRACLDEIDAERGTDEFKAAADACRSEAGLPSREEVKARIEEAKAKRQAIRSCVEESGLERGDDGFNDALRACAAENGVTLPSEEQVAQFKECAQEARESGTPGDGSIRDAVEACREAAGIPQRPLGGQFGRGGEGGRGGQDGQQGRPPANGEDSERPAPEDGEVSPGGRPSGRPGSGTTTTD